MVAEKIRILAHGIKVVRIHGASARGTPCNDRRGICLYTRITRRIVVARTARVTSISESKNPADPKEREKMLEKRKKLTLEAFRIAYEDHHRRKRS